MSNIYLFGDTHGQNEIHKLFFIDEYEKDDFIIVCGDFGVLWRDTISATEQRIMNEIAKLPCTLLFIDGNHENFNRLKKLKSVEKFGSVAGEYIKDKCYHLQRGEIYNIAGKNIFTMGGALSIDKEYRTRNISWWADEAITDTQIVSALHKLTEFKGDIDMIVTHTCPYSFLRIMGRFISVGHKIHDTNMQRLESILEFFEKKWGSDEGFLTKFTQNIRGDKRCLEWFFGHWHADFDFEFKGFNAHCLYNVAHKISENGKRIATKLDITPPLLYMGYEC